MLTGQRGPHLEIGQVQSDQLRREAKSHHEGHYDEETDGAKRDVGAVIGEPVKFSHFQSQNVVSECDTQERGNRELEVSLQKESDPDARDARPCEFAGHPHFLAASVRANRHVKHENKHGLEVQAGDDEQENYRNGAYRVVEVDSLVVELLEAHRPWQRVRHGKLDALCRREGIEADNFGQVVVELVRVRREVDLVDGQMSDQLNGIDAAPDVLQRDDQDGRQSYVGPS